MYISSSKINFFISNIAKEELTKENLFEYVANIYKNNKLNDYYFEEEKFLENDFYLLPLEEKKEKKEIIKLTNTNKDLHIKYEKEFFEIIKSWQEISQDILHYQSQQQLSNRITNLRKKLEDKPTKQKEKPF